MDDVLGVHHCVGGDGVGVDAMSLVWIVLSLNVSSIIAGLLAFVLGDDLE